MSRFVTPLLTEDEDDCHAKLTADLVYESDRLQRVITVPSGFETDFASVPRLPFVYLMAGGTARKAAVVHDFLYRQSGVARADCDAVFLEAMEVSGQSGWRSRLMWAGVRSFGWKFYKEKLAA